MATEQIDYDVQIENRSLESWFRKKDGYVLLLLNQKTWERNWERSVMKVNEQRTGTKPASGIIFPQCTVYLLINYSTVETVEITQVQQGAG